MRAGAVLVLTALLAAPAEAAPMGAAGLAKASAQAFGNLRGDYFRPNALVWGQIGEGLGPPRDAPQALGGGDTLYGGCRNAKCREKAAVILNAHGQVEAAALVHYACHAVTGPSRRPKPPRCGQIKTLSIFLTPSPKRGAYEAALSAWAKRKGNYDLKLLVPVNG